MNKQSFARGAVILAIASIVSRLLGVVYIVALPRIIRDEGMGLMQMVRPIHSFAVIMSIAGLPVALSKLVAEELAIGNSQNARKVFHWALGSMLLLGICFTGVLLLGGKWLVIKVVGDPLAYPVLMAMTPSLILLPVIAALRGLFQGMQYMTPSATSQVVEQVVRVAAMLIFAAAFMPQGIQYGAAGASLGGVTGSLAGLIALLTYYLIWHHSTKKDSLKQRKRPSVARQSAKMCSGWAILRRLFSLSLPLVLGSLLWPVMQMIDTGLVPLRMRIAGHNIEAIREALGYLGMALSLMHLPNVLTSALAVTLVPAVAEAGALKAGRSLQYRVTEALRVAVLFGVPASIGLFCMAKPVSVLLFGYDQVAEPLRILAMGTLTVGIFQVCSGVLQGLGLVLLPVYSLLCGVIVKFGLNYWLTAHTKLGIKGAAWGTLVGFSIAGALNFRAVCRHAGLAAGFGVLFSKAVLASAVMGLSVSLLYDNLFDLSLDHLSHFNANGLSTIISIALGAVVYIIGLIGTGTLCQRDLELIPKIGTKMGKWFKHRGWVK